MNNINSPQPSPKSVKELIELAGAAGHDTLGFSVDPELREIAERLIRERDNMTYEKPAGIRIKEDQTDPNKKGQVMFTCPGCDKESEMNVLWTNGECPHCKLEFGSL